MSAVNVLFSRNGLKQGRTKKHKKGEGARLSGGEYCKNDVFLLSPKQNVPKKGGRRTVPPPLLYAYGLSEETKTHTRTKKNLQNPWEHVVYVQYIYAKNSAYTARTHTYAITHKLNTHKVTESIKLTYCTYVVYDMQKILTLWVIQELISFLQQKAWYMEGGSCRK